MNLTHGKNKRKAISPVLATVILIAITLIAAIAIAGFVFGLFGSFTSTAQVSVTSSSMPSGTWATTGTVTAANTGTANTAINAITLTYGGATCVPTTVATLPVSVTAGGNVILAFHTAGTCAAVATSGEQFVGSLSLANGGNVQFTGSFQ